MILGEGAAMLVLEPLEAARARGARIHGEICGFGMSSDAAHITQPSVAGATRAMKGALKDAGIAPEQIGYINAHGTGTEVNDITETAAIRSAFGDHAGTADGEFHQIDARPRAGRGRSDGGRGCAAGAFPGNPAAHGELHHAPTRAASWT